ncbi:HET-domain-containing protein, partial [Periconia macrospinosa]
METFQHAPINTGARQIRLLNISPTADDDTLRCWIKVFDLDDLLTPDYRALSYTWGPPPAQSVMLLNEKPFLVRDNLYNFLYNFRARLVEYAGQRGFEEEVQWLWIDQICIDQSTTKERNHQVEMMSDIYRRANYVYVWLG